MIGITGGEPHAVICPTGTRVLYASDWSGAQDGHSIDCYVVELPINVSFVNRGIFHQPHYLPKPF